MDKKRFKSWLTAEGVKALTTERNNILNVKLPALRAGTLSEVLASEPDRRNLIMRVIYLNRMLNYNGNPETRFMSTV